MSDCPSNGMWPSPFNREFADRIGPDRRILFADCTMRDGEQQADVVLNHAAKLQIAQALEDIGIHEIEAGVIAGGAEDRRAIADICALGLRAKVSVLCRGLEADIDDAAAAGVWGVRLSFPISPLERLHKLKGISDADYLDRALALTSYAKKKGRYVVFSPYDTTRAELPFLLELVAALDRSGTVDRLRIVDTTGCALPATIGALTRRIRQAAPGLPLEIHCHDDFGLACANTLAAIVAGADYVSSTVNGLGERCGNASSEEVIMALEVLYGYSTGMKLSRLTQLSQQVATSSRIDLPINKPIVGKNAFRHESGMVVAGVLKDPFTAEPYAPEIVGQRRQILVGKKSGLASILHKAEMLGIPLRDDRTLDLLRAVKEEASSRGRSLTDDEFRHLANGMNR
jgi:isopropylmalate/homocitrate/citramalate synthase